MEKKKRIVKKLLRIILSVCLTAFVAFSACSCAKKTDYDYTASELKIAGRESFAPCWFYDFLYHNEYTTEYFSEVISQVSMKTSVFDVTIKGEKWTAIDFAQRELPQGFYDIVVETPSDCYLVEQTDTGLKKIPYRKKLIIPVFVWALNHDKYPDNG